MNEPNVIPMLAWVVGACLGIWVVSPALSKWLARSYLLVRILVPPVCFLNGVAVYRLGRKFSETQPTPLGSLLLVLAGILLLVSIKFAVLVFGELKNLSHEQANPEESVGNEESTEGVEDSSKEGADKEE